MTKNSARVLLFDIETAPNIGAYFQLYREGNIVWNERHWFILSFSYKWLGEKKIHCLALPDFPLYKKDKFDDSELVKKLWELFDKADVTVAHNGVAFDTKKANARFLFHKLQPPKPYFEIDTKLIAKKHFKFDSNKLDDLAQFLGLGKKVSTGGFELWQDCLNGDLKAWKRMKKYNNHDVILLEGIYLRMRPFIKTHPNIALMEGNKIACPNCGSAKMQKRGSVVTLSNRWQRYQCFDCGAWSKSPYPKFNKEVQVR